MSGKRDEKLARKLDAESELQGTDTRERILAQPLRRSDEPPELTDEDEEILDRIWAMEAGGEKHGNAN